MQLKALTQTHLAEILSAFELIDRNSVQLVQGEYADTVPPAVSGKRGVKLV